VERNGTAGQAIDENIIWRKALCILGLRHPGSLDNLHMHVAKSSALGSGRLYLAADIPSTHFS